MRNIRRSFAFALVISSLVAIGFAANGFAQNGEAAKPPMTEKNPKTTRIHDQTLIDNYFWLREKKNPKVLGHLEAENAYAEAVMKPTTALTDSGMPPSFSANTPPVRAKGAVSRIAAAARPDWIAL